MKFITAGIDIMLILGNIVCIAGIIGILIYLILT